MRNRKYALIIVILLVSLLVGSQVLAAKKGSERRRRAAAVAEHKTPAACEIDRRPVGGNILRIIGPELQLTDEQFEQIKDIQQAHEEKIQAAKKDLAEAKKALHEAATEKAGEEAIRQAAAQLGKMTGDLAVLKSEMMLKVREVLTDEQKTKMDQLLSERKERPGGFRRGGQPMPSERRDFGRRPGRGRQRQRRIDRPMPPCGRQLSWGCQCCAGGLSLPCGRQPACGLQFPECRNFCRCPERYQGARHGFGEPGAYEGFNIRRPFGDRDTGEGGRPRQERPQSENMPGRFFSFEKILERADTDNDGSLSAEELKALRDRIDKRLQQRPGRQE